MRDLKWTARKVPFVACALMALPMLLHAMEYTSPFVITSVYVSGGGNLHYRIYGMPAMAYCPANPNFAYVNDSDDGAKGKIAAILTAFAMGRSVSLVINPTNTYGGGQNFCQIVEILVQG